MSFLLFIIQALRLVIFADVILSWVMNDPDKFPRSLTRQITAPLYAPIHAVLNPRKSGGMDFSPLILLLLLSLVQRALEP